MFVFHSTRSLIFIVAVLLGLVLFANPSRAFTFALSKLRHEILLMLHSSSTTVPIEYDDLLPCPNPNIEEALDVVHICMDSLMNKSNNEGLEVCFKFSSDFLQAPFGGELEKFISHANNPVFQALVRCTSYSILSVGPVIAGTNTRGAMQTVLMDVQSPGSEDRRYLWTMQKERRPPRQNCWLVNEVLFTDNAGLQTT